VGQVSDPGGSADAPKDYSTGSFGVRLRRAREITWESADSRGAAGG